MIKKLESLRNYIDKIDNKIFNLIDKRLKKIVQISKIKYKYQISSYINEREEDLINLKIINNKRNYVSNDLINDILKRIMYESYNLENEKITLKKYKIFKIGIIGSRGNMGSIFKNIFLKSKYKIYEINSTDWNDKTFKILKKLNAIIISVPITSFKDVIKSLVLNISKNCILIDLSSIKFFPIKTMLEFHKGPVLGMHPIFGKDIKSITKQSIIICEGRNIEKCYWILKQFKLWGIDLIEIDYKTHDLYMSYIQSLRYFIFFSYGSFLKEKKIDIEKFFNYSTTINKIFLSILSRFFDNNINLYLDIFFSSENNIHIIEDYLKFLQKIIINFSNKNKNFILNNFDETKIFIKKIENKLFKINNNLIKNVDIYK